jgi:beta-glucosidase
MTRMTRRQFAQGLSAGALLGGALPTGAAPTPGKLPFPPDFRWGCATSAYQIEGAVREDGRGRSVWDTFSHTPGKIFEGHTGDVASDSYHRYREDVDLLRELGAKNYRFSIAWSRIFPDGRGSVNAPGVAYYDRLVDELLKHGITPYVTLFHWDLPEALPGGWQSRDTAYAFADYAGFMAKQLSDRVECFMTTNEMVCFTDLSYKIGQFAPGLKLPESALYPIRHHAALAHGLGAQAIRAHGRANTQVGLAENPKIYVPVIDTPEHIEAARLALREENAPFLAVVMDGKYPQRYLDAAGAALKIEPGDLKIIGAPLDFLGLNIYQPEYVRADASASGYAVERRPTSYPKMASSWLFMGPEVIYWGIRLASELWSPKSIYVTENGCSAEDLRERGDRVEDTDRVMFLRNYLTHLQRVAAEGYPVRGYFLWSLLDNFEWQDGYGKRFGIHYVDFKTQQRIPKLSARWYREVIARNAVE